MGRDTILDSRIRRRKLEYLVQWMGYDSQGFGGQSEATSWEAQDNVENTAELVEDFHQKHPDKPGPTHHLLRRA